MNAFWKLQKGDRVIHCEIDIDRTGASVVRLVKAGITVIRCRFVQRVEALEHAALLRNDLERDGWSKFGTTGRHDGE